MSKAALGLFSGIEQREGTGPDVLGQTRFSPATELTRTLLDSKDSEVVNEGKVLRIRQAVLAHSRHIRTENFTTIHSRDLEFLFQSYDETFFSNRVRQTLGDIPLRFRLSTRMTSAGGKTTRFRSRTGERSFEIAVACGLLFQGFRDQDRGIRVCGRDCGSRLDALLRIFEHELVHLAEYVCWGGSDCSGPRFQGIASRHFRHLAHTHELITWKERAITSGIRPGIQVQFEFEGRRLQGLVNRITKRATVLVEDPLGRPFTNGRRYKTYYVPIQMLKLVTPLAAP